MPSLFNRKKRISFTWGLILLSLCVIPGFGEESLFSEEASMLRILELQGKLDRNYLNYRSLDDEKWDSETIEENFPGLTTDLNTSVGPMDLNVYPFEAFLSYNSDYPYGGNDGALWQGVGFNGQGSTGVSLEAMGFSATLKPVFYFSQNDDFDTMSSAYPDTYGYHWAIGLDAYQRPGDSTITDWSMGDSEIRYSWKALTVGFGTQAVWLGPGVNNSLILSNNAAPFPKLDLGVRKTSFRNWGDFEFRLFWGQLTESDWFDDDSDNNKNLISAASASWTPSFFPELTLGLHRTMLSKWDDLDVSSVGGIILPNLATDEDESDQRFSFSGELHFPSVGFRTWGEIAYNDFYRSWDSFIRYPFHTIAFNAGLEKAWTLGNPDYTILVQGEFSSTESSRDTALYWPQTFYAHHIVTQGYTNEGQMLGAAYGTGGNYQNITVTLVHPKGDIGIYIERQNIDSDYIYFLNSDAGISAQNAGKDRWRQKAIYTMGADMDWIIKEGILLSTGLAFNMVHNPLYNDDDSISSEVLNSVYLYSGLKVKY